MHTYRGERHPPEPTTAWSAWLNSHCLITPHHYFVSLIIHRVVIPNTQKIASHQRIFQKKKVEWGISVVFEVFLSEKKYTASVFFPVPCQCQSCHNFFRIISIFRSLWSHLTDPKRSNSPTPDRAQSTSPTSHIISRIHPLLCFPHVPGNIALSRDHVISRNTRTNAKPLIELLVIGQSMSELTGISHWKKCPQICYCHRNHYHLNSLWRFPGYALVKKNRSSYRGSLNRQRIAGICSWNFGPNVMGSVSNRMACGNGPQ